MRVKEKKEKEEKKERKKEGKKERQNKIIKDTKLDPVVMFCYC